MKYFIFSFLLVLGICGQAAATGSFAILELTPTVMQSLPETDQCQLVIDLKVENMGPFEFTFSKVLVEITVGLKKEPVRAYCAPKGIPTLLGHILLADQSVELRISSSRSISGIKRLAGEDIPELHVSFSDDVDYFFPFNLEDLPVLQQ